MLFSLSVFFISLLLFLVKGWDLYRNKSRNIKLNYFTFSKTLMKNVYIFTSELVLFAAVSLITIDKIKDNSIVKGRTGSRKTIGKIIKAGDLVLMVC
jgi:chorismate-pyruvate lyase